MKLSILPCHHAPREARNITGHKECWPPEETRSLSQLVEAHCPEREGHSVTVTWERCASCGLYLGRTIQPKLMASPALGYCTAHSRYKCGECMVTLIESLRR